jgi:pilus assembly protein Flp/PilA
MVGLVWKAWVRATQSERGASLVEYALLLALIAMVCFAAVSLLGNSTSTRISGFGGSLGSGS